MNSNIKKFISAFLSVVAATSLLACSDTPKSNKPSGSKPTDETTVPTVTVPDGEMFTAADSDYTYSTGKAVQIALDGNSATCLSPDVKIDGGNVKITAAGTYILSGQLNGGVSVDVGKSDKVKLVLNGAQITNTDYAALYVVQADKTFVVLQGENTLKASGDLTDAEGVIHSKDDITLLGDGKLTVESATGKGIVGKNDVKITGGIITVTSGSHAVDAKNSVRIKTAALNLTSGKDGIHSEHKTDSDKGYIYMESGTVTATTDGDGLDASGAVAIKGGTVSLTAGGGEGAFSAGTSAKGVKGADMKISDGTVAINSADDGIHGSGSIAVTGGTVTIKSGDDGIHADGSLVITNGTVDVQKSYEGLEAQNITITDGTIKVTATDDGINAAGGKDYSPVFDRPQDGFTNGLKAYIDISGGDIYVNAGGDGIDVNGSITVSGGNTVIEGPTDNRNGAFDYDVSAAANGGTLVAIGSNGMAMNFTSAKQGCILVNTGAQSAGTEIKITSGSETVFSMTASKPYASVLITSPKLVKSGKYSISAGMYTAEIKLTTLIYGNSGFMRPMHR